MAGSSGISRPSIPVTLLRSKATGRVLYMEAGKDFVDILLSFLTLPTGSIIRMLSEGAHLKAVGAISNVFESVVKLDSSALYVDKKVLMNPKPSSGFSHSDLLQIEGCGHAVTHYKCSANPLTYVTTTCGQLCPTCKLSPMDVPITLVAPDSSGLRSKRAPVPCKKARIAGSTHSELTYYKCRQTCHSSTDESNSDNRAEDESDSDKNSADDNLNVCLDVTMKRGQLCPSCRRKMDVEIKILAPGDLSGSASESQTSVKRGYIVDNTTYMITDDLVITPTSTIRSIVLLNKLNVGNMQDLESFETVVGPNEVLQLLRSSLTSMSALNDVFGKN